MVQSLPGFLNLSLNVCSPCQLLGDVYTEVLDANNYKEMANNTESRIKGKYLFYNFQYIYIYVYIYIYIYILVLSKLTR